jgi:ferredoxin-NADP reductase
MKNSQTWHPAHIRAHRDLSPTVREFEIRPEGGVKPWTVGSHLKVRVIADGREDTRSYSLVGLPDKEVYRIAVKRAEPGRGGSRFMWGLETGAELMIGEPNNHFELSFNAPQFLLVAGGIGITPLATMAARRRAEGEPVRLHYAGRSRELMAFLPELQALLGDDLHVHADADAGTPLDIDAVLDDVPAGDRLYVCGPKVMLDAVLARTQARGWEHDRVHFELFTTTVAEEGDQPFEVELAQSGRRFTVPADQSILDCLIEHGCDPMYDCKRGECGVCTTAVLEGEIDHRDYVLSAREKSEGNVMQICISRAKGAKLVLDI